MIVAITNIMFKMQDKITEIMTSNQRMLNSHRAKTQVYVSHARNNRYTSMYAYRNFFIYGSIQVNK